VRFNAMLCMSAIRVWVGVIYEAKLKVGVIV
jgi:hypothetical protein